MDEQVDDIEATDSDPPLHGRFFRYPWLAPFLLAWTVGVVDASTFERYGVFTSNQAGNLVIIGTNSFSDPSAARLPALSLLGAVVGLLAGVWLAHPFVARTRMRVVAPMILGTLLVTVAAILDLYELPTLLIPTVSAGLACLASALIRLPAVGMWITANTGQVLTAISGLLGPHPNAGWWRGMTRKSRTAAVLLAGFVLGALCVGSGLLPEHAILLGLLPAFVAIVAGLTDAVRPRAGR